MIAVIFEVEPAAGQQAEYLDLATSLAPRLAGMDGFLSIERFQSLSQPGKLLSLSFWHDEAAVARWRNLEAHREAQIRGRQGLFQGYRLRVAAVLRDYGAAERDQAPADSLIRHGEGQAQHAEGQMQTTPAARAPDHRDLLPS
ncbi:MAG: antibiotic biosynthesis monooxygenase [Acidobacteria bacterium]|nr:antibiotic biosynthesis monooxygenase [Acidobacteriota bacterium]MBI3488004.1 antibiotic biosynthesis monooxygenase [Acidobacteriota bacterium]